MDDILDFSIFLDCLGFITAATALLILRKRKMGNRNVTGSIRKIIPLICVLFISAYCVVIYSVIVNNLIAALVGTGLLLLFLDYTFYFTEM